MWELFLLMLISVCTIATSAIGIQCLNANADYGKKKAVNKQFLVVTLVTGIIGVLLGLGAVVYEIRSPY